MAERDDHRFDEDVRWALSQRLAGIRAPEGLEERLRQRLLSPPRRPPRWMRAGPWLSAAAAAAAGVLVALQATLPTGAVAVELSPGARAVRFWNQVCPEGPLRRASRALGTWMVPPAAAERRDPSPSPSPEEGASTWDKLDEEPSPSPPATAAPAVSPAPSPGPTPTPTPSPPTLRLPAATPRPLQAPVRRPSPPRRAPAGPSDLTIVRLHTTCGAIGIAMPSEAADAFLRRLREGRSLGVGFTADRRPVFLSLAQSPQDGSLALFLVPGGVSPPEGYPTLGRVVEGQTIVDRLVRAAPEEAPREPLVPKSASLQPASARMALRAWLWGGVGLCGLLFVAGALLTIRSRQLARR